MKTWHVVTSNSEIILGVFYGTKIGAAHDYVDLLEGYRRIAYISTVYHKTAPEVGKHLSLYL